MRGHESDRRIKICVFGNSHVACIKSAWDNIAEIYPQVTMTFFASRQDNLKNLYVKDGLLLAEGELRDNIICTSGGHDHVNLSDYSHCFLCGLGIQYPYALRMDKHYTTAVQSQFIDDIVANCLGTNLLHKIRSVSNLPLSVMHQPLRASNNSGRMRFSISYDKWLSHLSGRFADMNVAFIRQPEETIRHGCFTDPTYTRGSRRLSVGSASDDHEHGQKDLVHMNEAYGRLILEHYLNNLVD